MPKRSLHNKLDSIRQHVVTATPVDPTVRLPDRYAKMAERLGGTIISNHAGSFCLVRTIYPWDYVHGTPSLKEAAGEKDVLVSAFTRDEEPGSVTTDRLLFFDTETTGLGGAGAVAFLVGTGSVTRHGFEVRQYVIPDYSDETAMLEALLEEFADSTTLVSYNGLTFDLPLLRDRLIVNRVGRSVPHDRHFDLLHAVRRLYRRRLGDCSLGNVEREVFGFERVDDIPGYLVPSVYFDWLSTESLDDMEAVMEHNRLDIISLYFLAACLSKAFRTRGETLESVDDLHSLSRIFGRRRDLPGVLDLTERVHDLTEGDLADDVLLFHAEAFKRSGEIERAVELWQQVAAEDTREGHMAHIQLAMYYEHRQCDYSRACQHARKAADFSGLTVVQKRRVEHRIRRLKIKTKR